MRQKVRYPKLRIIFATTFLIDRLQSLATAYIHYQQLKLALHNEGKGGQHKEIIVISRGRSLAICHQHPATRTDEFIILYCLGSPTEPSYLAY